MNSTESALQLIVPSYLTSVTLPVSAYPFYRINPPTHRTQLSCPYSPPTVIGHITNRLLPPTEPSYQSIDSTKFTHSSQLTSLFIPQNSLTAIILPIYWFHKIHTQQSPYQSIDSTKIHSLQTSYQSINSTKFTHLNHLTNLLIPQNLLAAIILPI